MHKTNLLRKAKALTSSTRPASRSEKDETCLFLFQYLQDETIKKPIFLNQRPKKLVSHKIIKRKVAFCACFNYLWYAVLTEE